MNKKLIIFFSFLVMSSSWAADESGLADKIYSFCKSSGGKVAYEPTATVDSSGRVCVKSSCSIDSRSGSTTCDVNIDSQTIPSGCARAVLQTCGAVVPTGGASAGTTAGTSAGVSAGTAAGTSAGSSGGVTAGTTAGNSAGVSSGRGSGDGDGDGDFIECEFTLSNRLSKFHPCHKACKKNWLTGKSGYDRKKCRECAEKYSVENGGDLEIDWSKIPGGKPSRSKDIVIGGVRVRTGEIICYDTRTGAEVSRSNGNSGGGSSCPSGSSTTPGRGNGRGGSASGTIIGNGNGNGHNHGNGNGNGSVVISGSGSVSTPGAGGTVVINAGGSAGGAIILPPECKSKKKKDEIYCANWMRMNSGSAGGRFGCSSSGNLNGCVGGDYVNDVAGRYDYDCPGGNCRPNAKAKDNSWIGEAVGGLAMGAGTALSAYFGGRAYQKGQEAWANAAVKTAEQCTLNNEAYRKYTINQELSAITPDQHASMGCNGYGLGNYAGLGNSGAMGAYMGGGYSPGYIGGMIGPHGGYNPYGGGMIGGVVGGAIQGGGWQGGGWQGGGWQAGGQGGIYPGYAGGMFVGGGQGGGWQGGGWQGGMPGAINGAIQGGSFVQGGGLQGGLYAQGGGWQGGGWQGGGFQGGINGAIQGGGWQGGAQGYGQGGIQGYPPGGWQGGAQGGIQGYAQGGGWQGGHNPGGGYNQGGWGSGTAQFPQQNYWAASQQSSGYDRMLQNQGISYQMGMGSGAFGGGAGSAGFNPQNMGGQVNAQFGAYGGWQG